MGDALSDAALDTIFRTARSFNGYTDEPVTTEQIHQIYDLLKMGPTSANQQPARFVWCVSEAAKNKLAEMVSEKNAPKIQQAPATVIIATDENFHDQLPWLFPHADAKSWFEGDADQRREHAVRNSSLQGAYFIIAARAIGLDTGPMSGFDNVRVDAEFFGDQPNVKSNFISTVGHGDPATIFDRLPRPAFDVFNTIA